MSDNQLGFVVFLGVVAALQSLVLVLQSYAYGQLEERSRAYHRAIRTHRLGKLRAQATANDQALWAAAGVLDALDDPALRVAEEREPSEADDPDNWWLRGEQPPFYA